MRRTIGLALLLALLVVSAGCNGEKVNVAEPEVLAGVDLKYHWRLDLRLDPGETLEEMWQLDEKVYCLTSNNVLLCIEAEVGHVRWSTKLPDSFSTVFRPSHHDRMLLTRDPLTIEQIQDPTRVGEINPFDAVLINSLTQLLVIDRNSQGEPIVYRNIELDFASNTGAVTDGESAFIGATDGMCHAILLGPAVHKWDLDVQSQIKARPETSNRRTYVAGTAENNNLFYCLRSRDEYETVWRQVLPGPVAADFHVDDRGCFVPCKRNVLMAFDRASGDPLWPAVSMEGMLTRPVQVSARSVFQYADMDTFYAIDIIRGSVRWTLTEGRTVLAAMNGKVYIRDASDQLRIVDEIMGTVEGTLPLTGFDLFVPNTQTPAIFAGSLDGRIFCINQVDQQEVTPGQ